MVAPLRGLLISVEGCDRGGKTTQCNLLQKWLSDHYALSSDYVKFPGIAPPLRQAGGVDSHWRRCHSMDTDHLSPPQIAPPQLGKLSTNTSPRAPALMTTLSICSFQPIGGS